MSIVAAGSIALVGLAAASPPPAQAAPIVGELFVCVTITPKSVSVTINDQTIGSPVVEQPRTCIFL
jgi:hypothetical protein